MLKSKHYKTIIVSDVHLGTASSKAKELVRFLKKNTCEKLILNGDIIDIWRLKRSGKWKKKHTRFIKLVIKMIQKSNTVVIYIRGNHDDFLDNMIPMEIGKFSIHNYYTYTSHGKKYYITHGDVFDSITTNLKWLAKLGDIGYTFLLWLNKMYNNRRIKKGLPYYSLSQTIKQKVKTAVSYINGFEKELVKLAQYKNCDGVICGHIHHASIGEYDGIMYMNSGDWVESLTALVEHHSGKWEIIHYTDLIEEERREQEEKKQHKIKPINDTAIASVAQ